MSAKDLRWALLAVCVVFAAWAGHRQWQIERGQQAFWKLGCGNCHFAGGGPALRGVTSKYDPATLVRFIRDPEVVYKERGKKPLNSGYVIMHKVNASDSEIKAIAAYLGEIGAI